MQPSLRQMAGALLLYIGGRSEPCLAGRSVGGSCSLLDRVEPGPRDVVYCTVAKVRRWHSLTSLPSTALSAKKISAKANDVINQLFITKNKPPTENVGGRGRSSVFEYNTTKKRRRTDPASQSQSTAARPAASSSTPPQRPPPKSIEERDCWHSSWRQQEERQRASERASERRKQSKRGRGRGRTSSSATTKTPSSSSSAVQHLRRSDQLL